MIKKCLTCPEIFETKSNQKKYCDECIRKRRVQNVMKSRQKKHPEIEIGVGSGKARNNKPGKENQSYISGITIYRKFIEKEECAICKSKSHLEIHHLDEDRYNNELENLVVWCAKCHRKYHTKRSPITGQYLAK